MIPFPLELPEELKERYAILDALAHRIKKDEMYALAIRLKNLKSEAIKRSIDWRASGAHYASTCAICRGSGQAHFCIDPFCHSTQELDQEDCLHFTPHELETFMNIHIEYFAIICEMNDLVATGIAPKDLVNMGSGNKLHQPN